jgi:hypothetical protein
MNHAHANRVVCYRELVDEMLHAKRIQKLYKKTSVFTCQEYHAYNKLARLDSCLYSHECTQVHKHSHTLPSCQAYLREAESVLQQPSLCICVVQGCIYIMCSLMYTICASVNGSGNVTLTKIHIIPHYQNQFTSIFIFCGNDDCPLIRSAALIDILSHSLKLH